MIVAKNLVVLSNTRDVSKNPFTIRGFLGTAEATSKFSTESIQACNVDSAVRIETHWVF